MSKTALVVSAHSAGFVWRCGARMRRLFWPGLDICGMRPRLADKGLKYE